MDLRRYFSARMSKTIPFIKEGNLRASMPWGKKYSMIPKSINSNNILCISVTSDAYDKNHKILENNKKHGEVLIELSEEENPTEILEEVARKADRRFMAYFPKQEKTEKKSDILERKISELLQPKNSEDVKPIPESVERVKIFFQKNPRLIIPEFFCDKEGIIRARWNHGANKTLWLNFPNKVPLGISLHIPKEKNDGLIKMNAKCIDDNDIVFIVENLGIKITSL